MTKDRWAEYEDQLETSLLRAERGKKDTDLIVLLRMAHEIAVEHTKREEKKDGE